MRSAGAIRLAPVGRDAAVSEDCDCSDEPKTGLEIERERVLECWKISSVIKRVGHRGCSYGREGRLLSQRLEGGLLWRWQVVVWVLHSGKNLT